MQLKKKRGRAPNSDANKRFESKKHQPVQFNDLLPREAHTSFVLHRAKQFKNLLTDMKSEILTMQVDLDGIHFLDKSAEILRKMVLCSSKLDLRLGPNVTHFSININVSQWRERFLNSIKPNDSMMVYFNNNDFSQVYVLIIFNGKFSGSFVRKAIENIEYPGFVGNSTKLDSCLADSGFSCHTTNEIFVQHVRNLDSADNTTSWLECSRSKVRFFQNQNEHISETECILYTGPGVHPTTKYLLTQRIREALTVSSKYCAKQDLVTITFVDHNWARISLTVESMGVMHFYLENKL